MLFKSNKHQPILICLVDSSLLSSLISFIKGNLDTFCSAFTVKCFIYVFIHYFYPFVCPEQTYELKDSCVGQLWILWHGRSISGWNLRINFFMFIYYLYLRHILLCFHLKLFYSVFILIFMILAFNLQSFVQLLVFVEVFYK